MGNCIVNECKENVYRDGNKCILHCGKENFLANNETQSIIFFFDRLKELIINSTLTFAQKQKGYDARNVNQDTLSNALQLKITKQSIHHVAAGTLKGHSSNFEKICFPPTDTSTQSYYTETFNLLGPIHFSNCKFWFSELIIDGDKPVLYENCKFEDKWNLKIHAELNNANPALYKNCSFHEDVGLKNEHISNYEFTSTLFDNCEFKKKLELKGITFTKQIFFNNHDNNKKIDQLSIERCTIKERFILNNCNIQVLNIKDSVFSSKFEFKYNTVSSSFKINNTNFTKLVDTFRTKYEKIFLIEKSIFDDFVGFEECEFGKNGNNCKENVAKFLYATFLSFVNFRNTLFYSGLDIENINLKEPPNFLNIDICPTNSNQETFRIIKNSFDKIGNNTAADIFFMREMQKYKDVIKKTGSTQEKIILSFNQISSDFGQNYLKPIGWILLSTFFYYLLQEGHKSNLLYAIYPPINECINAISCTINSYAKNIIPFYNKFLHKGMELISLLFYILNSSLIWLTIVAIKRRTKR